MEMPKSTFHETVAQSVIVMVTIPVNIQLPLC